ncbi:aminoglycoside phosphotransferase family protein [Microbacterium sp. XT11]|uniref:aminoglycoside phosphotransferase family protein n=1 Tax=Microbacterium sp. XT11 TaxID=367477 RepID=UPI000742F144|nr:aminoglycoside phosphotransferase family protein [Microbacterium sp. XT11]ALX66863.1 hypothetical protein AB663_002340 [Microbacterium sp. XT11]
MADAPAAERTLDEDGVRRLLRRWAPRLAELSLTHVGDGWDNAIWRLGDDLSVRIPRRQAAAPLIEHEQRALPILAPLLRPADVEVPAPVVAGLPSDEFPWPWSVTPWFHGSTALACATAENRAWAAALAHALVHLHVTAPDDAPRNPVRGVPLALRDAAQRSRLTGLGAPPHLQEAWDAGLAVPPTSEGVWIHGDLHPGNIVVCDGRLRALVDFGDVTRGDPAYDLASAWMLFDADGRSEFRAATGDRYDEHTWTRARAWASYIATTLLTLSDDRPEYRAAGDRTSAHLAEG